MKYRFASCELDTERHEMRLFSRNLTIHFQSSKLDDLSSVSYDSIIQ